MSSLSPVVRALLVLWLGMWILEFGTTLGGGGGWIEHLSLDPSAILGGEWTALPGLVTYALLHSPLSPWHLLFVGMILFFFGQEVERLLPGRRMVRFLLSAALAGGVVHLLLALLLPSRFGAPVIGGSGIAAAVLAAGATIYPGLKVVFLLFPLRFRTLLFILLAVDGLGLLSTLAGFRSGVAHDVHLVGYGMGWWAMRRGEPLDEIANWWAARRKAAHKRSAANDEARVDALLEKIGREGIDSLTAAERKFLQNRSKRP